MYNFTKLPIFALLIITSYASWGGGLSSPLADGVLRGVVVDSLSGEPLEYATVSVFRDEDNLLVTGTITDLNGYFRITNLPTGNYSLRVSFMGYHNKSIANLEVGAGKRSIDLGSVSLQSMHSKLDEVTVTTERPTMRYQIDKKVINVSQVHTSASGTAVDILESIPSVTVSIDGDVSLRGSGSFTVLVDGKPSIMDANDILNQIPASQIENIEIITNPSARFDPNGVAGIINIILKKNRMQGLTGVMNANAGLRSRYGSDFLLNYRKDRINLSIGGDFNQRNMEGASIYQSQTFRTDTFFLHNAGSITRGGNSWGVRAGVEYNVNPKSTFSLGYRLGNRSRRSQSLVNYQEWVSLAPNAVTTYSSREENTRGGMNQDVSFDFRREFDTKEHNLAMQAVWSYSNSSDESFNQLFYNLSIPVQGQRSIESGPENEFSLRADYTLPFGEGSKFEAGYNGDIEISDERNEMYLFNGATGVFEHNQLFSKSVNYATSIHAGYALLASQWRGLGYQFGLRAEHTNRIIDLVGNTDPFALNKWDFYPTVHFSYNLPSDQEVMASYTRRLQRLRGWLLEPFYTWDNAYNIRIGNPELLPEYIDSYELSYQKRFEKSVISLDLYYRISNNKIENFRSVYQGSSNVFLTTFHNVGKDYSLGSEVMLSIEPFRWWHLDIMGNLYDYRQVGTLNGIDYTRESLNWNTRINNSFRLARYTRLQISGMYNSPTISAQGEEKGYLVANLGIKQDFFQNALSLTLQVRDIFGTMEHERYVRDSDFQTYSLWNPESQVVSLTASFRLNNYRPERRRSPQMDDEMHDMGGEGGH